MDGTRPKFKTRCPKCNTQTDMVIGKTLVKDEYGGFCFRCELDSCRFGWENPMTIEFRLEDHSAKVIELGIYKKEQTLQEKLGLNDKDMQFFLRTIAIQGKDFKP